MAAERVKNVIAQFWVSPEMDETVRKIATLENRTLSSVYRDLVEGGLAAAGYISGTASIATMVREAVDEAIKPQVERLAAISAKGTQISAAAFFLAAYAGKLNLPEDQQQDFDETAALARKLGVEYLKLAKDKNLDAYIASAIRRLEDD